jgi:type IV secretory pathway VirJ component
MKPRNKIMFAAVGTCALALAMIWSPFSRVSLEKATVLLPVGSASSAPPAGRRNVLTIIYSGDGGWADLDKQLGKAFVDRGIPVLGVSTFKYYWRDRTPEESARQLDALMTKYLAVWEKQRIWLVGFSFGADVLPSIVDRLSAANRARITQLVLLSPSRDTTFEIELEGYMIKQGWFKEHLKKVMQHINPVPHYDSLPPLQALQNKPPVVCYYGTGDAGDSLCDEPGLPAWVTVHALTGGHHFDEGYQALAQQMLDELPPEAASAAGN